MNSTCGQMREVLALARDQAVDDADALAAANELFAQVRSNEAGAAGDEIVSHGVSLLREARSRQSWNDLQGVFEV